MLQKKCENNVTICLFVVLDGVKRAMRVGTLALVLTTIAAWEQENLSVEQR